MLVVLFAGMLIFGFWLAAFAPQDERFVTGMLLSPEYALLGPWGICVAYPCREMGVRGAASAGIPIVYSTEITEAGVGGTFIPPGENDFTADVIRIPCYANNCGLNPDTGDTPAYDVTFNGYVAGFNGGKADGYGEITCDTGSKSLGNGEWSAATCHFSNNVPAGKAFTIQWEASYYDEFGTLHWGVTAQPVCSSEGGTGGCTSKLLAGWTDFATGEGSSFYTAETGKSFDQMVAEGPSGGGVSVTQTATSSQSTTVTQTFTTVTNGQTSVVTTTVTGIVVQQSLIPWVLSDIIGNAKNQLIIAGVGSMITSLVGIIYSVFGRKFPKF